MVGVEVVGSGTLRSHCQPHHSRRSPLPNRRSRYHRPRRFRPMVVASTAEVAIVGVVTAEETAMLEVMGEVATVAVMVMRWSAEAMVAAATAEEKAG